MNPVSPIRIVSVMMFALLLGPGFSIHTAIGQQQSRPALTLEAINASNTFASRAFQGGRWADKGPVIIG